MTDTATTTATRPRGLLRRVLASELVDALCAPHGVDRYLELVDPSWTVRTDRPTASAGDRRGPDHVALVPPLRKADDGAPAVTFTRTGTTTSAPAEATLLEAAEAAGLEPRFRCRRGICGTCTVTKSAGTVRNLDTGDLSSDGPEPIRICVSVAAGDVEIDL